MSPVKKKSESVCDQIGASLTVLLSNFIYIAVLDGSCWAGLDASRLKAGFQSMMT
jgi:hypothetical protein